MTKDLRVFTLDEANALIPEIEVRLARLLEKKEQYLKRHDELFLYELLAQAEHQAGMTSDPEDLEKEIHALEGSIHGLEKDLRQIRELGCIIRNIEKGWVDFLGKLGGEYVYFCWHRGDFKISYYHSLKGGMTERKPLP